MTGLKKIQLNVNGPATVTAGMIECPVEVEIMNKDHEICTLTMELNYLLNLL